MYYIYKLKRCNLQYQKGQIKCRVYPQSQTTFMKNNGQEKTNVFLQIKTTGKQN